MSGTLTVVEKAFFLVTIYSCTLYLADLTFDQLVSQFRYYESNPEVPLYNPAVMRDFCDKNAPGLFDLLLSSITREDNRVSPERESLQK